MQGDGLRRRCALKASTVAQKLKFVPILLI